MSVEIKVTSREDQAYQAYVDGFSSEIASSGEGDPFFTASEGEGSSDERSATPAPAASELRQDEVAGGHEGEQSPVRQAFAFDGRSSIKGDGGYNEPQGGDKDGLVAAALGGQSYAASSRGEPKTPNPTPAAASELRQAGITGGHEGERSPVGQAFGFGDGNLIGDNSGYNEPQDGDKDGLVAAAGAQSYTASSRGEPKTPNPTPAAASELRQDEIAGGSKAKGSSVGQSFGVGDGGPIRGNEGYHGPKRATRKLMNRRGVLEDKGWLAAATVLAILVSYPLVIKPLHQVSKEMLSKMRGGLSKQPKGHTMGVSSSYGSVGA